MRRLAPLPRILAAALALFSMGVVLAVPLCPPMEACPMKMAREAKVPSCHGETREEMSCCQTPEVPPGATVTPVSGSQAVVTLRTLAPAPPHSPLPAALWSHGRWAPALHPPDVGLYTLFSALLI